MEQYTKSNHDVHEGVPFSYRLSVKHGRQYMYSATERYKLEMSRSREIQTRDVEGPFRHIRTCIYSPLKITSSVGTSQYKVAIGPLNIISFEYLRKCYT